VPVVAGCAIIDRRTFRTAPAPTAADVARAGLPALPLIVVRFGEPLDQAAIQGAVDLARARNPGAVFDVITPVPVLAPREAQAEALRQGRADAELVADALAAAGAARDHVVIGARADAGAPGREVRVYVR
jgi:hypothetical protein